MLGIQDYWIWSSYILCILSTLLCVVYGLYNWNKGGSDETSQLQEAIEWEKAEQEVESKL